MTQQVIQLLHLEKQNEGGGRGDSGFATTHVQTDSVGLVQLGDNVLCRSLALKHCVISL